MMKNKINTSFWLKSLNTNSLEPTNQNAIKVPKVFEPTIMIKCFFFKSLGTTVIYNPISPPCLIAHPLPYGYIPKPSIAPVHGKMFRGTIISQNSINFTGC